MLLQELKDELVRRFSKNINTTQFNHPNLRCRFLSNVVSVQSDFPKIRPITDRRKWVLLFSVVSLYAVSPTSIYVSTMTNNCLICKMNTDTKSGCIYTTSQNGELVISFINDSMIMVHPSIGQNPLIGRMKLCIVMISTQRYNYAQLVWLKYVESIKHLERKDWPRYCKTFHRNQFKVRLGLGIDKKNNLWTDN